MESTNTGTEQINRSVELSEKRHERWIFDIKRGRYPIRTIPYTKLRNQIEKMMIDDYNNNNLGIGGIRNLIIYQINMIQLKWRTIDDVPEELKDIVNQVLKNDNSLQMSSSGNMITFDDNALRKIVDNVLKGG